MPFNDSGRLAKKALLLTNKGAFYLKKNYQIASLCRLEGSFFV